MKKNAYILALVTISTILVWTLKDESSSVSKTDTSRHLPLMSEAKFVEPTEIRLHTANSIEFLTSVPLTSIYLEKHQKSVLQLNDEQLLSVLNTLSNGSRDTFLQFLGNSLAFGSLAKSERLEFLLFHDDIKPPLYELSSIWVKDYLFRNGPPYDKLLLAVTKIKDDSDRLITYGKLFSEISIRNPKELKNLYYDLDLTKSDTKIVQSLVRQHATLVSQSTDMAEILSESISIPEAYSKTFDEFLIANLEKKPEIIVDYLNSLKEFSTTDRFTSASCEYLKFSSRGKPDVFFEWVDSLNLNPKNSDKMYDIIVSVNASKYYNETFDYLVKKNNSRWLKILETFK